MESRFMKQLRRSSLLLPLAACAFAQIDGTWVFSSQLPLGTETITDVAKVELERSGNTVTGTYFGLLGLRRAVTGTYDGAQISLSVDGVWPQDGRAMPAGLTGSISTNSGEGT